MQLEGLSFLVLANHLFADPNFLMAVCTIAVRFDLPLAGEIPPTVSFPGSNLISSSLARL